MKPPLVYYGGKQSIIDEILPLIPSTRCYIEPFAGGATVLFAKNKSSLEVINDKLDYLVNFYRIVQGKESFSQLWEMVAGTLYSRSDHDKAVQLFKTGTEVEKAWATWYRIATGFSGKVDGGFSTTKMPDSAPAKRFHNRKSTLLEAAARLEDVIIENIDAIDCIRLYDSEDAFFYVDPPYLFADQGNYKGYTDYDFKILLRQLSIIKGKFLLSCYPGEIADSFVRFFKWNLKIVDKRISAKRNTSSEKQRSVSEWLIYNYDIDENQFKF